MPTGSANTCPRCHGRLLQEYDGYGATSTCIACGFVRDVGAAIAGFSTVDANVARSHEPHHGKGKRRFRL